MKLIAIQQGDGSLNPETSSVNITITANGKPHGVVSFETSMFSVHEQPAKSVVSVGLQRKNGYMGDLKVYYR